MYWQQDLNFTLHNRSCFLKESHIKTSKIKPNLKNWVYYIIRAENFRMGYP